MKFKMEIQRTREWKDIVSYCYYLYHFEETWLKIRMPLEFVKSNKGVDHLCHNGHRFLLDSHNRNDDKKHWKCVEYKRARCKGRVTTQGDVILRSNDDEHNHTPSVAKINAKRAITEMKKLGQTSLEPPHQILAKVSKLVSPAGQGQLPRNPALVRTIQRQRRATNSPLAIPKDVNDLVLPDEYKITEKGEEFILYDDGVGTERIIIFATNENLVYLASSPQIFSDGTFKSCPLLFSQLYTIHGVVNGKVLPLVYVLLKNKEEKTYHRLLNILKSNMPEDWCPETVTTDFEQGCINAFRRAFPLSRHQGCYFHFTQCVWRRIQGLPGVLKAYKEEDGFAQNVKLLAALAFIPVKDVVFGFEMLQNYDFFLQNNELLSLLDYFEENWIGKKSRHGNLRASPLYPIELWNVFEATLKGEARTNNSLEGWHRGFSSRLGAQHPNIWKFMQAIKLEQSLNEMKRVQLEGGQAAPPGRQNYRDCASRLLAKALSYSGIPFKRAQSGNQQDGSSSLSQRLNASDTTGLSASQVNEILTQLGAVPPQGYDFNDFDAILLPPVDNTEGELYSTVHQNRFNETLLVNYLKGVAHNIEYNV